MFSYRLSFFYFLLALSLIMNRCWIHRVISIVISSFKSALASKQKPQCNLSCTGAWGCSERIYPVCRPRSQGLNVTVVPSQMKAFSPWALGSGLFHIHLAIGGRLHGASAATWKEGEQRFAGASLPNALSQEVTHASLPGPLFSREVCGLQSAVRLAFV